MHFIYQKGPNSLLRGLLKPFAPMLPSKWHFPVHGTFTLDLGEGQSLLLETNPTSYLSRLLFWGGIKNFEYHTVRIFSELVKKKAFFLDVGANIGYYSLTAAKRNPNIRIIGFEPMPAANHYFQLNARANGLQNRIQIESLALSNTSGTATFFAVKSPKYASIQHHLNGDGTINPDNQRTGMVEPIPVTTQTMDGFLATQKPGKVDLIKLDTEASEHLVLSGATNVLQNHRPIILCEVIKNQIEPELEALLKPHDYCFFRALPQGLKEIQHLSGNTDAIIDHYFVPKEQLSEIQPFLMR